MGKTRCSANEISRREENEIYNNKLLYITPPLKQGALQMKLR